MRRGRWSTPTSWLPETHASRRPPEIGRPALLDLTRCDTALLDLVDSVVRELLATSPQLTADDVMLVGAGCRDLLQSALGHGFPLRATEDIDLGLAVSNWSAYDELTENLPAAGDTGIRYRVGGVVADLMPFGPVENPPGKVTPAARREPMSVWGFTEVFEAAVSLPLSSGTVIRLPTVAGYTALKLAAWLDRSDYGQYKDASDIATAIFWYARSLDVESYLYEDEQGLSILLREDSDSWAAAAHVLGRDVAAVIGPDRRAELAQRWPGRRGDHLGFAMTVVNATDWTSSAARRQALIAALERGLGIRV
jgi:predicted nucleotidyltransferase